MLAFGKWPVEIGSHNECTARYVGATPEFSYKISKNGYKCWTKCFYFEVPYYVILVASIGEFNIYDFVKSYEIKNISLISAYMGLRLAKQYDREMGKFLISRAYSLLTNTFDPKQAEIDEGNVSKMVKILSTSQVVLPSVRLC